MEDNHHHSKTLLKGTKSTVKIIKDISFSGPSMLSEEEKEYYFNLGTELVLQGVVVDAGCWLGSSSFFIGKGIEANPNYDGTQTIYACDLYKWDKTHNLQIKGHAIKLNENDDFQFLTSKFLNSLKLKVETKKIDYSISPQISNYHTGEPIEVLLIDAGKTPELLFNILEGYLPFCIENKTIIFFQDYRDYWCWFIPPVVEFLNEVLEPVIYLGSGGAGFKLRNKESVKKLLPQVRTMFNSGDDLLRYYKMSVERIGTSNIKASYQLKANMVGVLLHLLKVTEVYYGTEERATCIRVEDGNKLMQYFKQLDVSWPIVVLDGPLQNAFRRIKHALTGTKDLSLKYKSVYCYKRRLLNPIYLKVALKKILGR